MDYEEFRRRLGQRITALRLEQGIKQELLAELIDKSYEGIELTEIWKVHPSKLEELFKAWERWIDASPPS